MSKKKHKIEGYLEVFRHKLDKLCKKIKKARETGELNKEHTKRMLEEAKNLKKTLGIIEEE